MQLVMPACVDAEASSFLGRALRLRDKNAHLCRDLRHGTRITSLWMLQGPLHFMRISPVISSSFAPQREIVLPKGWRAIEVGRLWAPVNHFASKLATVSGPF